MGRFYASEGLDENFQESILRNMIKELFDPEILISHEIGNGTAEVVVNIEKGEFLHRFDLDQISEKTLLVKVLPRTENNPWSEGAKLMVRQVPDRDKLKIELSLEKL
jgi:hypothetical protein